MKRTLLLLLALSLSLGIFAQKGSGKIIQTIDNSQLLNSKLKTVNSYDTLKNSSFNEGCFDNTILPIWGVEDGYAAGNNIYNQKYAAQAFYVPKETNIVGMLFFAKVDTDIDTTYGVLFSQSTNAYKNPDTIIAKSAPLPLAEMNSNEYNLAYFETPIKVNQNFFAAIELPQEGGEIGLGTTNIGCYTNLYPSWVHEDMWIKLREFAWDYDNNIYLEVDLAYNSRFKPNWQLELKKELVNPFEIDNNILPTQFLRAEDVDLKVILIETKQPFFENTTKPLDDLAFLHG